MATAPVLELDNSRDAAGEDDRYCLGCGYNLRGLSAGNCPECGRLSDGREQAGVRLPWAQRGRLGTLAAYWQTVLLVSFRPAELADRFHWPKVRYHGSSEFRTLTVGCAAAATVVATAAVAWQLRLSPTASFVLLAALLPSSSAFFYGATELAGLFAGPRSPSDSSEEGFRAGIVNDYASAALAWTPLPALAICAGAVAVRAGPQAAEYFFSFGLLLTLAVWLLWLWNVLVIFATALSLGPAGIILAAIFFPIRCGGLAVLTLLFFFLPLACCVAGVISLRP